MWLFGCVTYNVRGKKYNFCEAPGQNDQGGAFI